MNLTKSSDYTLRVLLYLAVHPDRPVAVSEISRAYDISSHLLVKIVQRLTADGIVKSDRGRHGGLRLSRPPQDINVGALVRRSETTWELVECFDRTTNTCPIVSVCGLKGTLEEATRAFLAVLDRRTLADLLPQPPAMKRLLHIFRERRAAS